MKVLVVGGGVMGLSAAWALARRGHAIELFEQGPIPNPLGSSCDEHRAIRHAYGTEEGYARLVGAAYRAWDEMGADLGEQLHMRTGVLALDRGGTWARDSARILARIGVEHRVIDADTLAQTYPLVHTAGVEAALDMPGDGVLKAQRILERLHEHLVTRGAAVHTQTRIADIDVERARVRVSPDDWRRGDALVVAAGPWVARLLPDLEARVTPSRQLVAYLAPADDLKPEWRKMPIVVEITASGGVYLIPPRGDLRMKIGVHTPSLSGDPDRDREATAQEARHTFETGMACLAEPQRYRPLEAKTCFYTVSPDERFLVRPLAGKTWVMTGFSGHGFKFGALMGRLVAEGLEGARSPDEVASIAAASQPLR